MEVDDDDKLPEFFKVYISQHSSKQMSIPGKFVDYMGEMKSGPAKLVVSSGQTWLVELVDNGNDLHFTDGWQDFVEDNMIQDGEFLFFKFHGNLKFSIVIYDESMCERGAVFTPKCSQGREAILEPGDGLSGVRVRPVKRNRVGPSQPEGLLFPSEDKMAQETAISVKPFFKKCIRRSSINRRINFNLPLSFVQEHSLSYKSNEKMVLRTSRNSSWEVNIIVGHGKITLSGGWAAFVRENSFRVGDVCKFELLGRLEMMVSVVNWKEGIGQTNVYDETLVTRSLKRTVGVSLPGLRRGLPFITEGKKKAARTMPSSAKPSFVLDVKKYNVKRHYVVYIPAWFIQENSLQYQSNEKMILRTKRGSSWPVNITRSKYKNNFKYDFGGGWAKFVYDNNIKEGDTCKFELLNRLEMKVHITPNSK